ncbi:MAG: Outer membrane lipoprotein LptE/RlpB (LPS assembly) [Candidatus Kentron sp. G]|nr:MAG: Outer membrane lipoprotein LptE/RlpB (LPS assembly) [Candidatus Kentron sp. G]VFM99998.1 MAG: Outer membrane lipoprotein LptE/RlpB (LPS assembly) [Candidatus Kentron sp. G]VFN04428.1 MAG: Outer membrane lipoprotein LptE/RlpB (LPS assembly) [Candidatus Kentron sp. G]
MVNLMQNADKAAFPLSSAPLSSPITSKRGKAAHGALIAILVLIAATLSAGCGFHLRGGAITLPDGVSSLRIQGPAHLVDELTMLLEGGGVTITSNRPDAILIIEREHTDRRVLSVDSDTGKERERELSYTVVFRVVAADGKELFPRKTVNFLRDYVFDERAVYGSNWEKDVLYKEMRRTAANRIFQYLAIWGR